MTATSYTRDAYIADLRAERNEAQAEAMKANTNNAALRALVKEMTGALDALFEYPDNGTAVHPGALVWEDARTALAKAREIAP